MSHSKEPWVRRSNTHSIVMSGDQTIMGAPTVCYPDRMRTADANRIVACVNALAGYNPEAVRAVIEAAKWIDDRNRQGYTLTASDKSRLKDALSALSSEEK